MGNKILIVEDDAAISELICMNLGLAGYECTPAVDGERALELSAAGGYDLALLDIMLPGIDGFELMEHMKKHEIPVIYLTAKNDVNDKVKGLRSGAEDYIVKPFEILELLARMEKVLQRHSRMPEVYEMAGAEINTAERTVRSGGKIVPLKPMEFDLLVMFVKNRNIALSREKLLQTVWGEDYFGEPRTVDVHIAQLRKKMGWGDRIRTVHKMGYRLEV
jgi:DNA-binding response OmpR family regulator